MRRPQNRCEGVRGSRSFRSDDTYVNGLSLSTASISTMSVCKTGRVTKALPNTFCKVGLLNPPYQGARLGSSCQS